MRGYETREEAVTAEKRSIALGRSSGRNVVNGTEGGETGRGSKLYPNKLQPGEDTFKVYRESSRLKHLYDSGWHTHDYDKFTKITKRVGARVCARFQ